MPKIFVALSSAIFFLSHGAAGRRPDYYSKEQALLTNYNNDRDSHVDFSSFEYNNIPHYFKRDITPHERSFFQEYRESLENNNYLYFARFINYFSDRTPPPLFGNGLILGRFESSKNVLDFEPRSLIKRAVVPRNEEESNDNLKRDNENEKSKNNNNQVNTDHLFVPNGNFTNFLLLNTSSSLSSTIPFIIPVRLSVSYKLDYSSEISDQPISESLSANNNENSPRPLSLIKLSLKSGEINHLSLYTEAGLLVKQTTFAHRSDLNLMSQSITLSRSNMDSTQRLVLNQPISKHLHLPNIWFDPTLLQSTDFFITDKETDTSQSIKYDYVKEFDHFYVFSGVLTRTNIGCVGIVVIQEKAPESILLNKQETHNSLAIRTLIKRTRFSAFNENQKSSTPIKNPETGEIEHSFTHLEKNLADVVEKLREDTMKLAIEKYAFGHRILHDHTLISHRQAWNSLHHMTIELRHHHRQLRSLSKDIRTMNRAKSSMLKKMQHHFHSLGEHYDESYFYDYHDDFSDVDGSNFDPDQQQNSDSELDGEGGNTEIKENSRIQQSYNHGMPHALQINQTIYTLMTFFKSNLNAEDISNDRRLALKRRLQTPDYCYHSHPTAHVPSLWMPNKNIFKFVKIWALTLEKHGCSILLSEGGEGFLQGMILSFAGLQFQHAGHGPSFGNQDTNIEFNKGHLQLDTDPDILHNSFTMHGIFYENVTIDIEIIAAGERLLLLNEISSDDMISIDGSDADDAYESIIHVRSLPTSTDSIFICGAGCSEIIQMQPDNKIKIPIYITEPMTPILYASKSKQHLTDLASTLHIKHIINHADHLENKRKSSIAQRKKVGATLWVTIIAVIILFHVFLIRLIITEYQQWNQRHMQYEAMRPYYSRNSRITL